MPETTDSFETALTIEVSAEVTHPPGTELDADGNPIPPKDDQ
jgi:hypothetical protein